MGVAGGADGVEACVDADAACEVGGACVAEADAEDG